MALPFCVLLHIVELVVSSPSTHRHSPASVSSLLPATVFGVELLKAHKPHGLLSADMISDAEEPVSSLVACYLCPSKFSNALGAPNNLED